MSDLLYALLLYPIIFILPAWIANGTPVLFGGGVPLDLGKKLAGKPIFGKHKTLRGTASGIAGGAIIAVLEYVFFAQPLALGVAVAIGAIAGDLVGSFAKRRLSLKEGANVWILDQYSFFVVALLFSLPFGGLPSPLGIIVLIVLTGVLHKGMNVLAHRAKIKRVPW
ncbi:MAG: CDP-archaeol synthase [Candidatus Micrarchaeota archaeon]|nr:CDP-archaeol synthase [Candidatus Micrarchaeota archaeon]